MLAVVTIAVFNGMGLNRSTRLVSFSLLFLVASGRRGIQMQFKYFTMALQTLVDSTSLVIAVPVSCCRYDTRNNTNATMAFLFFPLGAVCFSPRRPSLRAVVPVPCDAKQQKHEFRMPSPMIMGGLYLFQSVSSQCQMADVEVVFREYK
jgi:hypothetical protein